MKHEKDNVIKITGGLKISEKHYESAVYETAICFARMWGVMETLESIPNLGFDTIKNLSLEMAQGYIVTGQTDLTNYFIKKSTQIKKKYI